MIFQKHRLSIPSNVEYSVAQLKMMLNEVELIISRQISIEEWETLA
jgi:hypothetical protein